MADYTPTTDQVRDHWGAGGASEEGFDRWLAAHDAEVAAQALEAAAGLLATARPDTTREQIDVAVGGVLFNAMNHPDPVAVLGKDMGSLRTKVVDAVMTVISKGADQ